MDVIPSIFDKRLAAEIARLEETAAESEGEERDLFLSLVRELQREQGSLPPAPPARRRGTPQEQARIQETLENGLHRIDTHVRRLEVVYSRRGTLEIIPPEQAHRLVHWFLYHCEMAQQRLQHYGSLGYFTPDQVEDWNDRLRTLVHRMFAVSRKSQRMVEILLDCFESQLYSEPGAAEGMPQRYTY